MMPIRSFVAAVFAGGSILLAGSSGTSAQTVPEPPPAAIEVPGGPSRTEETLPSAPLRQAQRSLDLVVTITMSTGKSETFAREVDRLEIVTFPDGRIEMVHLVLIAGGERNTHVWYNFSQVAKLSYRFVTPEGRDRVQVRVVQSSLPAQRLDERLEPISPRDYK